MISLDLLLILAVFWIIVTWSLLNKIRLRKMLSRARGLWALDLAGLMIHGAVVPLFQSLIIFGALKLIWPIGEGLLTLPRWISFFVAFVVVDYAYYWNHRLLHQKKLWRFHAVHHSGQVFDVFTTSRNSALTTFLILYVWFNGIMFFLLSNREAYIWGVAVSNALDLLRHSGIAKWPRFAPFTWFISPRDHAWHHSEDMSDVNFGGNLNIWDRIHGTYHGSENLPHQIGAPLGQNLWSAFWHGIPSGENQ